MVPTIPQIILEMKKRPSNVLRRKISNLTLSIEKTERSVSDRPGIRCPICFWALYDGDYCQGPKWCENRGKSVEKPVELTNAEAKELINYYCSTCGRHIPCRHCT